MKAVNPYLPNYEYIPDGEPHVFGDRVYIYGSHDKFNGYAFCLNDYVCWSADVSDLANWRYEGVIYRRNQDPRGLPGFFNALYAPDVCQGPDGRYYLYYFLCNHGYISVAVCDTPAGKYEYLGDVKYPDGTKLGKKKEPLQFDPGIFVDDDKKIYLYTGFGPVGIGEIFLGGKKPTRHGPMAFELENDMLTIKQGPQYIGVKGATEGKGTKYEGHEFFEASSMRKRNNKYYFIYSSILSHELCYAIGDAPFGPFEYGGTLVSNGDLGIYDKPMNYTGNTHGSIENINGKEYVFYHRHTNLHWCSRQACAEPIRFEDGKFYQAELTSSGFSEELDKGQYGAYIACHLFSKNGTFGYLPVKIHAGHPYFTQHGHDREDNPNQYIKNMRDGATCEFKYFTFTDATKISFNVTVHGKGKIVCKLDDKVMCEIPVEKGKSTYSGDFKASCKKSILSVTYKGQGHIDFISFEIK